MNEVVQVCIVNCTKETIGKKTIYMAKNRTMKYMYSQPSSSDNIGCHYWERNI